MFEIDLTKVDINFKEVFYRYYNAARFIFDTDPVSAPAKLKKTIRKWIVKNCRKEEKGSENLLNLIPLTLSDDEVLYFCKACFDYIKQNGAWDKQLFEKAAVSLSDTQKAALWELLENGAECGDIKIEGDKIHVSLENCFSCRYSLTLSGCENVSFDRFDSIHFGVNSFKEQDGKYRITGIGDIWEDDSEDVFSFEFTGIDTDIKIYRVECSPFCEAPWQQLMYIATEILHKYALSPNFLNDEENKLLPLICEIAKLSKLSIMPEQYDNNDFSSLRSYAEKYNYKELLPLINKLENEFYFGKRYTLAEKLIAMLNKVKYEPMWRELYSTLTHTQSNYPSKALAVFGEEKLLNIRQKIEKYMHNNGYTGAYPNFTKNCTEKHIRLTESFGISYFAGVNKYTKFHISCNELCFGENLVVGFLCGAELLKKNEAPTDVLTCLFDNKGKKVCNFVLYEKDFEKNTATADLEQIVGIAVKKAELQPLNRTEQEIDKGFFFPAWKIFLSVFLLMGGLFAVLFTPAMMAACSLLVWLDGFSFSDILGMHWLWVFIFSWVGFGTAMGVITVLARKK